jgi:hypothetical protein
MSVAGIGNTISIANMAVDLGSGTPATWYVALLTAIAHGWRHLNAGGGCLDRLRAAQLNQQRDKLPGCDGGIASGEAPSFS